MVLPGNMKLWMSLELVVMLMLFSATNSQRGMTNREVQNILQGQFPGGIDPTLLQHTHIPTEPSPEDVNCHVEIATTTRVGGKCVTFGQASQLVCQAGMLVDSRNSVCAELQRQRRNDRSRPYRRQRRRN